MYVASVSALPVALLGLVLLSSVPVVNAISDRSICVRENARHLADAAACGEDRNSLRECLLAATSFVTLDNLQRCFIEAHCKIAESVSEAKMILESCDTSTEQLQAELRRRRDPEATPVVTPTSTPQQRQNDNDGSNDSTTSPSTATATGVVTTTNACNSTDNGDDCTWHNDNSVPVSGIVIGVLLGIAGASGVATLAYFYTRERRAHKAAKAEKRAREKAEAAAAALRKEAQDQVEKERAARQLAEAREWAIRCAIEDAWRRQNPFDDADFIA